MTTDEIQQGLEACTEYICNDCPYQYLDDKEYDLRCIHTLVEDSNKLNKTLKKIADFFEDEDNSYYNGWFTDKWYEIKNILEEEYWSD